MLFKNQNTDASADQFTMFPHQSDTPSEIASANELEERLARLALAGRRTEFQKIVQVLKQDRDLLITGVPGSGRRTLVRRAAQEAGAIILDVDCVGATSAKRFVQLLCKSLNQVFCNSPNQYLIEAWISESALKLLVFEHGDEQPFKLAPKIEKAQLEKAFKLLIGLPQTLAKALNQRIVVLLQNFSYLRSWDRGDKWGKHLRQEFKLQTEVSYVLVGTIADIKIVQDDSNLKLESILLAPLEDKVLEIWVTEFLDASGLSFDPLGNGLEYFLEAVQGHFGYARSLARHLELICKDKKTIDVQDVKLAVRRLLDDLWVTFESLLRLLPDTQLQLLECLALESTAKPFSREYTQKHNLPRGGTLQGALTGLQQKGLIYDADQEHRLGLPLMALWIRQQIT